MVRCIHFFHIEKHKFGRKDLLTYLRCEADLIVQQLPGLCKKFHKLVPLKVWNVYHLIITGRLETLASKEPNNQEE